MGHAVQGDDLWYFVLKCIEGIDTDTDKLENHHPSTVEYEAPA